MDLFVKIVPWVFLFCTVIVLSAMGIAALSLFFKTIRPNFIKILILTVALIYCCFAATFYL